MSSVLGGLALALRSATSSVALRHAALFSYSSDDKHDIALHCLPRSWWITTKLVKGSTRFYYNHLSFSYSKTENNEHGTLCYILTYFVTLVMSQQV